LISSLLAVHTAMLHTKDNIMDTIMKIWDAISKLREIFDIGITFDDDAVVIRLKLKGK